MVAVNHQSNPAPALPDQVTVEQLLALRHQASSKGERQLRLSGKDGLHVSALRGRGLEFDDVRLYQSGDDVRHLDWRLMARTGQPHTRLFHEERDHPVYLLVDMGARMQFASRGHFKSVLAAYGAALVYWAALNSGDRVGGSIIGLDSPRAFKPRTGRQAATRMLSALSESSGLNAKVARDDDNYMQRALLQCDRQLVSGSRCYIFSDFHQLDDQQSTLLQRIARRCQLNLIEISDPLEKSLPDKPGFWFSDPFGSSTVQLKSHGARASYKAMFDRRYEQLIGLNNEANINSYFWDTDNHPLFKQDA